MIRAEGHELVFARESVAQSRALLHTFLAGQELGERTRQDAVIVLGELVSNGLDHGSPNSRGAIEITFELRGGPGAAELLLGVADGGGRDVPRVVPPDPESARGRGLAMVQAVARTWTAHREHGTRVEAVLPVVQG